MFVFIYLKCNRGRGCVAMSDVASLRGDVKLTLIALLKSFPSPMTLDMLEKDYLSQVGRQIPFMKLGYTSLLEYLQSIPEAVNLDYVDDNITVKASNIAYVKLLPVNQKKDSICTEQTRRQCGNVFVPHHIQHSFYKFLMDHKTGVHLSEVEEFWEGGQTLAENGIQSTVVEFLRSCVTHLAFVRDDHVYPFDLDNVRNNGATVSKEDLPVLKLAAHVDNRTKIFIRKVLAKHPGGIHYCRFPEVFKQETGVHFECGFWGYHSVLEMALHIPELFLCVQVSISEWTLFDARQTVPKTSQESVSSNIKTLPVSCNDFVNGHIEDTEHCGCADKAAVVQRLYGSAEFVRLLKSCTLSCDAPCNKFHKIPQLNIPQHILPGVSVEIHVSEVHSPDRFFFVLKERGGKEVLDHLRTVMYEFYSQFHMQFQVNRADVAEGLFCVALYSGQCLRSQVHGSVDAETETVPVRFVDYGVVAPVDVDSLYYLHPSFGFLPQQALTGRLAGVRPVHGGHGWSREACVFLYSTLVNSLVTAVVMSVSREQQVVTAELVAETDSLVYVGRQMVAFGYAARDCL